MQNNTVPGQQTRRIKEQTINYNGRHFLTQAWAGIGGEVKRIISD
jgi:hypothetical protein